MCTNERTRFDNYRVRIRFISPSVRRRGGDEFRENLRRTLADQIRRTTTRQRPRYFTKSITGRRSIDNTPGCAHQPRNPIFELSRVVLRLHVIYVRVRTAFVIFISFFALCVLICERPSAIIISHTHTHEYAHLYTYK